MTEERDDYFKNPNPDTIPTPPDQEDIASTDMISEAVEEIMDHVKDAFEGNKEEKKE